MYGEQHLSESVGHSFSWFLQSAFQSGSPFLFGEVVVAWDNGFELRQRVVADGSQSYGEFEGFHVSVAHGRQLPEVVEFPIF